MSFCRIPSCAEAKLRAGEPGLDGHSGIVRGRRHRHRGQLWTWAVGTRGDQPHVHTQGRTQRPKGGKARLYPNSGASGDTIRTTNPTKKPPWVLHRDGWDGLSAKIRESFSFLNKEEIPRAPPAAETINNLSKTTTRQPFSPRRAPPCSPPLPAAPGSPAARITAARADQAGIALLCWIFMQELHTNSV